jgi:hypothetical protein
MSGVVRSVLDVRFSFDGGHLMFHVGQRVCCVDDANQPIERGDTPVILGEVYTVRECYDCFGSEGIRVLEIFNRHDRGYHRWRFQPYQQTDISIFTAMLNPSKQGVDA